MVRVTVGTRGSISPYAVFDRASWRALAAGTRLPLDEAELRGLATLGDRIDLDEVATVYLPLAELLDLHVAASRRLWAAQSEFLGNATAKVPVRHRGRRQRRRRQEHDRPPAADAARRRARLARGSTW